MTGTSYLLTETIFQTKEYQIERHSPPTRAAEDTSSHAFSSDIKCVQASPTNPLNMRKKLKLEEEFLDRCKLSCIESISRRICLIAFRPFFKSQRTDFYLRHIGNSTETYLKCSSTPMLHDFLRHVTVFDRSMGIYKWRRSLELREDRRRTERYKIPSV